MSKSIAEWLRTIPEQFDLVEIVHPEGLKGAQKRRVEERIAQLRASGVLVREIPSGQDPATFMLDDVQGKRVAIGGHMGKVCCVVRGMAVRNINTGRAERAMVIPSLTSNETRKRKIRWKLR